MSGGDRRAKDDRSGLLKFREPGFRTILRRSSPLSGGAGSLSPLLYNPFLPLSLPA